MRRTAFAIVAFNAAAAGATSCDTVHMDAYIRDVDAGIAALPPVSPVTPLTPESATPTPCPTERPTLNTSCTVAQQTCEYGTNPAVECNDRLTCLGTGTSLHWASVQVKECAAAQCPTGKVAADLDGRACELPADVDGGPEDADELFCRVPEGVCVCTTGRDAVHAHARSWVCFTPLNSCPLERPHQGQACTSLVGAACDYGSCVSKGGVAMICNGTWQVGGTQCN